MKHFFAVVALVSLVPVSVTSLTINTPISVVECQPELLSWSDGLPPYYLTIMPGAQPSAAPPKSSLNQSGSSAAWIVDIINAGKPIPFLLKDDVTGATAYTDIVTIQKSPDAGCSNSSSSNIQPA